MMVHVLVGRNAPLPGGNVAEGYVRYGQFASLFRKAVDQVNKSFFSWAKALASLYGHLYGKVADWVLVICSAAVYLLNHIYRLDGGLVIQLYLFLLGVLFILPVLLTRRLWFTGGFHWAGNVTFYLTRESIKTDEIGQRFSANHILILVILLFIPLNYAILKTANLIKR